MGKKTLFGILVLLISSALAAFYFVNKPSSTETPKSPIGDVIEENIQKVINSKYDSDLVNKDRINILLLGIDRRSKAELGYRTDIMILVSVDKTTNQVVMTSVPRDLWWGGGRVNAVLNGQGWESLQTAFNEITGITPDRFVLTDFEDFVWIVDSMGGVPVDIQTTFTDSQYPVDETFEYQTVTFTQGTEKLTGERALIFARSRKGDFDNGDWGRMKRQHLILKGFLDAVVQPESIFNPMVVEKAFELVTNKGMETNLTIEDSKFLWDFYKDKDQYNINSLFVDHDYLYTPPMSEYGGAWVLAPINNDFTQVHTRLEEMLNGIVNQESAVTE